MNKRTFSAQELAKFVDGILHAQDGDIQIKGFANLKNANTHNISFVSSKHAYKYLHNTKASIVLLKQEHIEDYHGGYILVNDPYLAYAKLSHLFESKIKYINGVHKNAVIDASAQIGQNVCVGANTIIEANVVIGDNVTIGHNCSIATGVFIGDDTTIHSNVVVYHDCIIGKNCNLQSTCVIGGDGFGFARDGEKWQHIAQVGRTLIGDNVYIGAGTTIDRGAIDDTIIGDNCIIDNLIMIGHNVQLGAGSAMAGMSGIAGSAKVGKNVTIAGKAGINGHITITDNVFIGPMGMVTQSIDQPGSYSSGVDLQPTNIWMKNALRFRKLDEIVRKVLKIEKLLNIQDK